MGELRGGNRKDGEWEVGMGELRVGNRKNDGWASPNASPASKIRAGRERTD